MKNKVNRTSWIAIPPWVILGAVIVLVPIFVFWTQHNLNKQREDAIRLLAAKGAALIRSFEAGTRTGMMGMMGMHGGGFQLQRLLMETAQQPDIVYLIVTDTKGNIRAHNAPEKIGGTHGTDLDLDRISDSEKVEWRQVTAFTGAHIFEVFRRFAPTQIAFRGPRGQMLRGPLQRDPPSPPQIRPDQGEVIFVGLDMGPIEAARREDTRHTIVMAFILLLIGCAGVVSLFLAQAYRSTRTSLTRIKAFSDKVVENMPVGLMAVDGEGRIASFNQAAESILGQSALAVIGKSASEVLPGPLWELTDSSANLKTPLEKELNCPLAGGKNIPMDVSVSSLSGEDGSGWGPIVLFRDLTEVQNLKREIEKSRRLASLGRLATGVAHEIRNPLSSIKGFATYFKERYRDNPEDQKTAEIMI
ncbi:MAG: PAS domain S-box protein, partial [Pseudomonadota bacterium]